VSRASRAIEQPSDSDVTDALQGRAPFNVWIDDLSGDVVEWSTDETLRLTSIDSEKVVTADVDRARQAFLWLRDQKSAELRTLFDGSG
jgi:hypothetical protein